MLTIVWTPEAKAAYDELKAKAEASLASRQKKGKAKSSRDEGLFKQVHKTLTLLASNPKHPGLQTHEFCSLPHPYDQKQKVLEAYAQHRTPVLIGCSGVTAPESSRSRSSPSRRTRDKPVQLQGICKLSQYDKRPFQIKCRVFGFTENRPQLRLSLSLQHVEPVVADVDRVIAGNSQFGTHKFEQPRITSINSSGPYAVVDVEKSRIAGSRRVNAARIFSAYASRQDNTGIASGSSTAQRRKGSVSSVLAGKNAMDSRIGSRTLNSTLIGSSWPVIRDR